MYKMYYIFVFTGIKNELLIYLFNAQKEISEKSQNRDN